MLRVPGEAAMTKSVDGSRQPGEVTQLLERWRNGDEMAYDELLPLVYNELRRLANSYLRRERQGHTLEPTALVHEAYMRLDNLKQPEIKDRSHFFAIAARAMRRILVEHARSQLADKRIGAHQRLPLQEAADLTSQTGSPDQVIAVHDALKELLRSHPRCARLVELRFFGGLSEDEAAEVLGASRATLSREWRFARLWLYRRLQPS